MNAPTRAQVESVLVNRCGAKLAVVGLATTTAGTNADLDDAVRAGLAAVGLAPAGWVPADADCAAVAVADWPLVLDVAELRCLETVLGNIDEPDGQQNTNQQQWGKFATTVQAAIDAKRTHLERVYQFGINPLVVNWLSNGTVELPQECDW